MKVSVEISIYPLDKQYATPIRAFLDRISSYQDLTIHVQPMSTYIVGEYDFIMELLKKEIKNSFQLGLIQVTVLKMINLDLSDQ